MFTKFLATQEGYRCVLQVSGLGASSFSGEMLSASRTIPPSSALEPTADATPLLLKTPTGDGREPQVKTGGGGGDARMRRNCM